MKSSSIFIAALMILIAVLLAASGGKFYITKLNSTFSSGKSDLSTSSCDCNRVEDSLDGVVEDCCCDYATVNTLNLEVLHPLLQKLVCTPFFRYFKAKLWCDCPFWPDDGMCALRDCSVCECPPDEFPENFQIKGPSSSLRPSDDLICQEGKPQAVVDRTLESQVFRGWTSRDNPWTWDDEREEQDVTYVNLLLNPERYTGYKGSSARRIWDAIYNDNVLKYDKDAPAEDRVLYKLISGLHSSISVHIAAEYLLDKGKNEWGYNLQLLHDRVLKHPDRVRNLYFTYLLVLRAVTKASNYLLHADFNTGNPSDDTETAKLVKQLVQNERLKAACPKPFDEAKLWQGEDGNNLLLQLQIQFRNISAIMDCVGCEKCRLWGKLQILGLGIALEILFSDNSPNEPTLQRNEVIALINLLNRLSESVYFVHKLAPMVKESSFVHSLTDAPSESSMEERLLL